MSGESSSRMSLSRRNLLRTSAAAGAGLGFTGLGSEQASAIPASQRPAGNADTMLGVPFGEHRSVRVGVIGVGNRGASMLPLLLAIQNVRITAICDTNADFARKAAKSVVDAGRPEPVQYTDGEEAFEKLLTRDDVDFVYIATPWQWHTPMALAAMRHGKHVGVECPIGTSVDQLWELVDTSERTRKHCIQLENCCYGRTEMRVLRLAHEGKFGNLLYGAGAYLHDLREELFSDSYYQAEWRRAWHTERNGDLYPTHSLGPVASYMDINRGDRLVRMTSMSTPALGLGEYREQHESPGDSSWSETYRNGDATMSMIQTEQGRMIQLVHDVSSPRPYSRINLLQGTRGVFEDYPARIYLEPDRQDDQWDDFQRYENFDHWLWKEVGPGPGGHGGMDYIMLFRLIQTMRLGLAPDIDVYDSATWSAPFALSVESVANNSAPVEYPDFTRGHWRVPHPGTDSKKP